LGSFGRTLTAPGGAQPIDPVARVAGTDEPKLSARLPQGRLQAVPHLADRLRDDGHVNRLERDAIRSTEELVQALASAREELRRAEQMIRRGLRKVEQGNDVASVILATPPSESRQAIQDALSEVNRSRHKARLKIFALALAQGVSIGELGRAWGISRQLASRYAQEATGS
jgi:hypothetical protein